MNASESTIIELVEQLAAIVKSDNDGTRYLTEQLRSHGLLEKVSTELVNEETERAEDLESQLNSMEEKLDGKVEEIQRMNIRFSRIYAYATSIMGVCEDQESDEDEDSTATRG